MLRDELEKALENRLGIENKALDSLFQSKDLKVLPKTRDTPAIKNLLISSVF